MASIEFSFEINYNFNGDPLRQAVADGLEAFARQLLEITKPHVPERTGRLVNSGFVTAPEWDGQKVHVDVGYGGPEAPYALYVHEDLHSSVHWEKAGSGPKFLENPAREHQNELPAQLAEAAEPGLDASLR